MVPRPTYRALLVLLIASSLAPSLTASRYALLTTHEALDASRVARTLGLPIVSEIPARQSVVVVLPDSVGVEEIARLIVFEGSPIVSFEEDGVLEATQKPLEFIDKLPFDGGFWHQPARDSVRAGLPGFRPPSPDAPLVAVLDTGIDPDHPLFEGALVAGIDLVDEDDDPQEALDGCDNDADGSIDEGWGHGTHVAGLVRATAPNARLLPIRVLDSDGCSRVSTLIRGLDEAVERGARVVVVSAVTFLHPSLLDEAVADARAAGVLVVASAGNHGTQTPVYPAACDGALAVASTNIALEVLESSGRGSWIDIAAPGDGLLSAYPGGFLCRRNGTSMAAPLVAGALARLVGEKGDAEPAIELLAGARDIRLQNPNLGGQIGAGGLDVRGSLTR